MALVNSKELLKKAREDGYAVPQFNASNLEIILGIIKSAEALKSPVIIGTSGNEIKHSSEKYLVGMVKVAAEADIPVALNLDHGKSLEQIERCVSTGYTSCHLDGSELSYEENIELTKKAAEICHSKNVQIEGELGKVPTPKEDGSGGETDLTDPSKVFDFVQKTGIDSLAISVGTAHGPYKGESKIDFKLLEEIAEKTEIPLVLHGASMVPDEDIRSAISLGISKININTELRKAFVDAVKDHLEENPNEKVPHKMLDKAIENISVICEDKIRLFGSNKK